ncbi:MAG: alkaline phosphatase family protein [Acidobacteriaceae bacterium]
MIAIVHTGYGSFANGGAQSVTLIDSQSGKLNEYNESRLKIKAKQSYSFGIAFSSDGRHLYVPFGSTSDPTGKTEGSTGNGIGVYRLAGLNLSLERIIALPPVRLPSGKHALQLSGTLSPSEQTPFPAGIAVFQRTGREKLAVAEQLSDTLAIVDVESGSVEATISLGQIATVPSVYPYNVVADKRGTAAYVSLWNSSEVVKVDLATNSATKRFSLLAPSSPTEASSHPAALVLSPDASTLYVALANRDAVAAINLETDKIRYAKTVSESVAFKGASPQGMGLSVDGKSLFVSNASQNSVAVLATSAGDMKLQGTFPTLWYPTVVVVTAKDVFIATAKGRGTGPNGGTDPVDGKARMYGPRLLRGSITQASIADIQEHLPQTSAEVSALNYYREAQGKVQFATGKNPIKHVVYVIKENRTYDQVFGDMKEANGDPSLVMYGENITPNEHALARQFGILDNFYDSGEVSGGGHVWSTAAITCDYTERIWPITYRGEERTYDFEGNVSNSIPLLLGIGDVNEPATGYIWSNLARNGRTYRHYGEFIESSWCGGGAKDAPEAGEDETHHPCPIASIEHGMLLPSGVASPYPWSIPVLYRNIATKPELRDHFDPGYPDFNLSIPDQLRADEFIREFKQFEQQGAVPEFMLVRLPNDHTSGATARKPSPRAAMSDNDLALGRIVEAVSHTRSWDDTAIFVLEDDAQDGADHVDSHRSPALVISKYSPAGAQEKPFVESGFYTTVNMIHTMEALLGLPPMNQNDAYAPLMSRMFSGSGTQAPFNADHRNEKNGMIYEMNAETGKAAKQSAKLNFSHADAADATVLNRILWHDAKGNAPMPKPVHRIIPAKLGSGRDDD